MKKFFIFSDGELSFCLNNLDLMRWLSSQMNFKAQSVWKKQSACFTDLKEALDDLLSQCKIQMIFFKQMILP